MVIISSVPAWVKVAGCITCWYACSVAITLEMKHILGTGKQGSVEFALYPYPFALTAVTNGCTAILAHILASAARRCANTCCHATEAPQVVILTWKEVSHLAIIGIVQGLEIGFVNKALEFLTVSKRTMIFSTSLCFTMVISFCFRLEHFTGAKIFAALFLVSGGVLQGISTWKRESDSWTNSSMTGYCLAIVSMLLAGSRWALAQYLLQNRAGSEKPGLANLGKFEMISRIMPLTVIICGSLAAIFETPPVYRFTWEVFLKAWAVALGVTILAGSEFLLVQITSAVALNVAGALHNIPVLLGGILFFGDEVQLYSAFGFGLCVVGALLYTLDWQKGNSVEPAPVEEANHDYEMSLMSDQR
eukprot:gnl/MRDRNA2_/MRDRNA2_153435_c0_seq1.p1 gnl/MRDRNA2_/MRDRNA2_153435_c0~~gnl/MRDRNA2_/MRDRNA2_153435_c0_seq1.p1  ORF type:complete len:361 (+),score=39.22 gnl/MRDRNA2_/MRDRNA2_153435_c0_seq1:74-1156(+)